MSDSLPYRLRFGQIARLAGFVTDEQVEEALEIQAHRRNTAGEQLYIGTILRRRGHLTLRQALAILDHQRVAIMDDGSDGFNVHGYQGGVQYVSPRSQALLRRRATTPSLHVDGDVGLSAVQPAPADLPLTDDLRAAVADVPGTVRRGRDAMSAGIGRWAGTRFPGPVALEDSAPLPYPDPAWLTDAQRRIVSSLAAAGHRNVTRDFDTVRFGPGWHTASCGGEVVLERSPGPRVVVRIDSRNLFLAASLFNAVVVVALLSPVPLPWFFGVIAIAFGWLFCFQGAAECAARVRETVDVCFAAAGREDSGPVSF